MGAAGSRTRPRHTGPLALALLLVLARPAAAQPDPEPRANLEVGVEGPLRGESTLAGYAFLLWNRPHFPADDESLRVVIAPTYLESELVRNDWPWGGHAVGLGISGGGFRFGHEEFRRGQHLEGESFWGHGVEVPLSYYPGTTIAGVLPLEGQIRLTPGYHVYQRSLGTRDHFELPPDSELLTGRLGLRLGGVPPELLPNLALEASIWYEATYRAHAGRYGLAERPQELEHLTHRAWARLAAVLTPARGHTIEVATTAGVTADTDPLSSFRLGSALPFRSEFPLILHGYFVEEIFARRFWLVNASYRFPAWPGAQRVQLRLGVDYAYVDYLAGHALPRRSLRGLSADVSIALARKVTLLLGYGYGADAPRGGTFGGHEAIALVELKF